MILLLSNGKLDKSIEDLYQWIKFYNGNVIKINSNDLYNSMELCVNLSSYSSVLLRDNNGSQIDIDEIKVVWYWRWHEYDILDVYSELCRDFRIRNFLYRECEIVSSCLFQKLVNKKWYGHKFVNKLLVLEEAEHCGLSIPATIVTNRKSVLLSFFNVNKNVIVKPLSDPVFIDDNAYALYTSMLTDVDFIDMPESIFPVLCQKYISKDYEIRTFYLDGHFYSAAIISQNNEKTKIDFRNYDSQKPNRIVPYKLPDNIEDKLNRLMVKMGLITGSIDIIYKDGNYCFLEVNPVGQYEMISYPCNYNLSSVIAEFLIRNDNES